MNEIDFKRVFAYARIIDIHNEMIDLIGEVINLYELIIAKSNGESSILPGKQSACFQDLCSRRLYDLNRRKGELKDFVYFLDCTFNV